MWHRLNQILKGYLFLATYRLEVQMTKQINELEIQEKVVECSDELLDLGVDPLEVAAVHMIHAMKIYRTVMTEDEYNEHMNFVVNFRDPKPFQTITRH
jgi:hypothetical protein